MSEPAWIMEADCLSFHEKLLGRFGGAAGVRDPGLLASALARPRQLFASERPTLFDMAAAYAHGIVKNHPFVDGNKRSGLLAAALFLEVNGIRVRVAEEEAVVHMQALAAGTITPAEFATWLARGCGPATAS
jgi:death-on-curing protein